MGKVILRDESIHRRLGPLYFEWAMSRIDARELTRLGRVLYASLDGLRVLWNPAPHVLAAKLPTRDMCALGWLDPARYAAAMRAAVVREVIDPLATIGIALTSEQKAKVLA